MIKILGKTRIAILGALIVINAVLGAIVYMYLIPEKVQKDRELSSVTRKVRTKQADISKLQVEFEQLEEQRDRFEELKGQGFFSTQQRRQAQEVLQQVQRNARVISARASVGAGEIISDEEAEKADHVVLKSPITVTIEAIDDTDVFRYLYLMQEFFPGHITVDEIVMRREKDLSGTVLRAVANGTDVKMVDARISMTWSTMIPKDQIITREKG